MRAPRVIAGLVVALVGLSIACSKPTVGKHCKKEGVLRCSKEAPSQALLCSDGTYIGVECRGPRGCQTGEAGVATCDTSVSNPSERCFGDTGREFACTPDHKRQLVCTSGRYQTYLECRGPNGCKIQGATASCDVSLAARGDACLTAKASACNLEKTEALICRDGKFALSRYCRGERGCTPGKEGSTCDDSRSLLGDPCTIPGYLACSVDGKEELLCQGGAFMHSRHCRRKGCTVGQRLGEIDCD